MSVAINASSGGDATDDRLDGLEALLVPIARLYLGPAAATTSIGRDGEASQAQLLQLALAKLVIEAGTLPPPSTAYAPHSAKFTVDDKGNATALDLPYVLGALRAGALWAAAGPAAAASDAPSTSIARTAQPTARELRTSARTASYASSAAASSSLSASRSAFASGTSATASSAASVARAPAARKSGCGCGGGSSVAPPTAPPSVDCIPRNTRPTETCSCGTCAPPAADPCAPWTPSCDTRNRLRTCARDLMCDLLACVETAYCADATLTAAQRAAQLRTCLADLVCKALRCVREALCPPATTAPPPRALPPSTDCLPCDYAVEDPR